MTAYTWFVALLDAVGSAPRGARTRQCPAHADASPSLSLAEGHHGRVLLHCHAGCSTDAVLAALRVPRGRLFRPTAVTPARHGATFCAGLTFPAVDRRGSGHPTSRGMRLEAQHPYGDSAWLLRYRHPVTGAKDIAWESLNPDGERVPGLLGRPTRSLPLYRERDVVMGASAGEPIVLVESESSVDALRGLYATTWAGGADAPPLDVLTRVLGDAALVIVPDHDDPGLACLARLRTAFPGARVLLGEPGEDARDVHSRLGPSEFARLVTSEQTITEASR